MPTFFRTKTCQPMIVTSPMWWDRNEASLFYPTSQGQVQLLLQRFPTLQISLYPAPAITQDLENGADLNNGDTFGEDWALQSWSYEEAVAANQRLASSSRSYHPLPPVPVTVPVAPVPVTVPQVQMQWTRDEGNLTSTKKCRVCVYNTV